MVHPMLSSIGTSVGTSVASQVLGRAFGGKEKRGPDWRDQIGIRHLAQESDIETHWGSTMKMAKKHGIHPLVALGISPSTGPAISGNTGTSGIDGQNLGRALQSGVQNYREKQLYDLQVERAKLENDLLRTQITNVNQQAGDPPRVVDQKTTDAGIPEAVVTGKLPRTGKKVTVFNPELGDVESMGFFASLLPQYDIISGEQIPDVSSRWDKTKFGKKFNNSVVWAYRKNKDINDAWKRHKSYLKWKMQPSWKRSKYGNPYRK